MESSKLQAPSGKLPVTLAHRYTPYRRTAHLLPHSAPVWNLFTHLDLSMPTTFEQRHRAFGLGLE